MKINLPVEMFLFYSGDATLQVTLKKINKLRERLKSHGNQGRRKYDDKLDWYTRGIVLFVGLKSLLSKLFFSGSKLVHGGRKVKW